MLIRPQEPGDITRIQRRGCHLVQQRLERVIGVTIDQRYVHVHASQPVYSGQASKPATDNNDMRPPPSPRGEISDTCLGFLSRPEVL